MASRMDRAIRGGRWGDQEKKSKRFWTDETRREGGRGQGRKRKRKRESREAQP